MTPKEKAKDLYARFHEFTPAEEEYEHEYTKNCALICVDEILRQLGEMCKPEYTIFWHGNFAGDTIDGYELQCYWQQVKEEINKL